MKVSNFIRGGRLLCALLPLLGCGAHGQVKPNSYVVNLTWTQPAPAGSWAGCSAAQPCSYVVSRAQLSNGATTCPAPNYATPNYTPINQGSPAAGLTYTDSSASGSTVCYVVQTVQGGQYSFASNTAGPFAVPASPGVPGSLGGNQVTASLKLPTVSDGAPVLMAKVEPVWK